MSFSRNIGVLSFEEQEVLRQTKIAVLGLGGIGGPCFEVLTRTGIGAFHIVDCDTFEASNKNRQIHAKDSTLGQSKIEVAAAAARDINAEVAITKFHTVTESNIAEILHGCRVVVHGIDELKPCIISARYARRCSIPIVEGWSIPYGNVRVLTPGTPSLEESHRLPTLGRPLSDISDEEFREYGLMVIEQMAHIDGVRDYYTENVMDQVRQGLIPSFAPMTWFTSVMMAIEVIKICLGQGSLALGPEFALYDPFEHRKRFM